MSIRPQYVAKILNGNKTIEIRKKFPKDYVGWVYIYCCKNKPNLYRHFKGEFLLLKETKKICLWNGKVVARFWCDKVEPAYKFYVEELCQLACINKDELYKYAGGWYKTDDLLAINIDKVEIFDKPKEISEFKVIDYFIEQPRINGWVKQEIYKPLTKAPQSWCYTEV